MWASINGCKDIVSLLLSNTNIDVNIQNKVNIYNDIFALLFSSICKRYTLIYIYIYNSMVIQH